MGYLLSIVVPTKDRYFYLKHLIQLIHSFNSNEIELVIQDNTADNTEILEFIDALDFSNLRYYHTHEPISVSENSSRAIRNSSGEYICFIGDDDGVTRHIVDCVMWMQQENIDVVKSEFALYKWPSFPDGRHMKLSSTLALSNYTFHYEICNLEESLVKLIRDGFSTLNYMPKVYNGIVKRTALEAVYKKTGTYFPGPSPDMANAVALCFTCKRYAFVDFPIIIGGQSVHVGGGARTIKGGYLPLNEVPFLPSNSAETWEDFLPKIWCVETVWPESGIKGLKAMGQMKYVEMIDVDYLLSRFIVNRPDIQYMAEKHIQNKKKVKRYVNNLLAKKRFQAFFSELNYLLRNRDSDNLKIIKEIEDIEKAESLIHSKYPQFTIYEK